MAQRLRVQTLWATQLLVFPLAFAQDPVAMTFHGKANDPGGKPLKNFSLVLGVEKQQKLIHVPVGADGTFSRDLPSNAFRVVGTAPRCFVISAAERPAGDRFAITLRWDPKLVAALESAKGGTSLSYEATMRMPPMLTYELNSSGGKMSFNPIGSTILPDLTVKGSGRFGGGVEVAEGIKQECSDPAAFGVAPENTAEKPKN